MSDQFIPSFLTLPVELVYRILDHLDEVSILWSMWDVCRRMNAIVDSYHRYQVISLLFQTLIFIIYETSFIFTTSYVLFEIFADHKFLDQIEKTA
jgi:hypothetical protein